MEKELEAKKPEDAIKIIDMLTKDINLKRHEGYIFGIAINTLYDFVNNKNTEKD